jgi:hypothetical protein
MANTFTNLNYTILSDTVFEEYVASIAPLKTFSLDVSPKPAERGTIVQALFVPTQNAASNFTDGTGYTIGNLTATSVQVTLDEHPFVSAGLTDTQITNMPQVNLEKFGNQLGFQLGKSVFQTIMGGFVSGGGANQYPNTYASSGSLNVAKVIAIGEEADNLFWPENDRTLIVPPSQYASLLSDPNLLKYLEYGSDEPIKKGVIPKVVGFDIIKSTILPSNVQFGLAVRSDAMAVGMRPLLVAESHDYYQLDTMTSAEGFVITYRRWYDRSLGQDQVVWECVYGFEPGLTEAAIIFTS